MFNRNKKDAPKQFANAHWNVSKATAKAAELLEEFEKKAAAPPGREQAPVFMTSQMKLAIDEKERAEHMQRVPPRVLYFRSIIESTTFQTIVVLVIIMNTVTVAFETGLNAAQASDLEHAFYYYVDAFYMAVYTVEFVLKIYVERWLYFRNGYNRFDAFILLLSYVQILLTAVVHTLGNLTYIRVLRSLRALRAFRSISFIRSLQVLVSALIRTLKRNVLDLLLLLFLCMYIFGVMGHYLFGIDDEGAARGSFGSLASSFYVLFVYVTMDGWMSYQYELWDYNYPFSEYYTLVFIFIGGFIFTNLFIGVICQNIDDATEADKMIQTKRRREMKQMKKDLFSERQKADMNSLLAHKKAANSNNMQELLASLAGSLRHDEVIPMMHLSCDLVWMETYMVSLHYHENTIYRCQQTQFNIANTLCSILDRRYRARAVTDV